MNRRDIIKKAVLVPFVGVAAAKAVSLKSEQKIYLDDIVKEVIVDKDFKTYIESIHKVFEHIFDKSNIDIHHSGYRCLPNGYGEYVNIYLYDIELKTTHDLFIGMSNCFVNETPAERIERIKSKLKRSLEIFKNKCRFYTNTNEVAITIDLRDKQ